MRRKIDEGRKRNTETVKWLERDKERDKCSNRRTEEEGETRRQRKNKDERKTN